jgi:hypothetical protein
MSKLGAYAVVAGPILVATATYIFACWQLVDVLAIDPSNSTNADQIAIWSLLCLAVGPYLITLAVKRGFRRQSRGRLLLAIATSYVGLILVFASTYYVFCAIGDQDETFAIAQQYREWLKHRNPQEQPQPVNLRAFTAMESLWTGADSYVTDKGLNDLSPSDYLRAFTIASGHGKPNIDPVFKRNNRLATFLDCLYFSVVTMTTTGYGDIHPIRWYSKLAVETQILTGVAILVFALGMLFGNWWRGDLLDQRRERLLFGEFGFHDSFWHDPFGALQTYDSVRVERQASVPPVCPWCGSQNTASFGRLFPAPREPERYDPRHDKMTIVVLLCVSTYAVYSLVPKDLFASLPEVVRWLVRVPLIGAVAMLIQLPFSLLSDRIFRNLEKKWKSEYDKALTKFLNSWSCETCRNIFSNEKS